MLSTPKESGDDQFNRVWNVRLGTPLSEIEVEKYFRGFEKVVLTLKWPKTMCPLPQSVLNGKAQDSYAAIAIKDSANYELVNDSA